MSFDEIQNIFFQECEEGLANMEACFSLCRDGVQDDETINTIFRAVHSIKGGAGAFGFEQLRSFAHHYETLLDKLRNGVLTLTPDLLSTLMAAFDMLSDHVAAASGERDMPDDSGIMDRLTAAMEEGGGEPSSSAAEAPAETPSEPEAPAEEESSSDIDGDFDFDDLLTSLDAPAETEDKKEPETTATVAEEKIEESDAEDNAPKSWLLWFKPDRHALDNGSDPLLLLRELDSLGAEIVATDYQELPTLEDINPEISYLGWWVRLPADTEEEDIRSVFEFVGDISEVVLTREGDKNQKIPSLPEKAALKRITDQSEKEALAKIEAPKGDKETTKAVEKPAAKAPPASKPTAKIEAAKKPASPTPAVAPAKAPPQPPRSAAPAMAQTIRVDLEKLDRLVNLVGELVITQAMLAQRLTDQGLSGSSELTDLDHLTRELQDSAMSIRAQPMKTVFSRVPRIIRELEGETGKKVRLDVIGEMTEVDKTVVERIGEPLTHLIRNAVDHGLETPEERVAAGKPQEGVVTLAAEHRSGRIIIRISDDGKGMNRTRILEKAIEKGIVAPDQTLSDDDIDNLIFAPGFSTAAKVTNVSGRGVGMDVVRKNVQALGGRISINSRPGFGSTFTLSLPLTLAVLDGMIVKVGDQTFVIPLGHIVESLQPNEGEISGIGTREKLLNVRGAYVPIQSIGRELSVENAELDPFKSVLIVVESDGGQAVLMVDQILDQRQVVVKSLEANYQAIAGLAGATILGDGRVALILDVDSLVARWRHDLHSSSIGMAA
ncbi:two-component system chemotaxis sensor kinase CheA [Zymomonas mobilis]|uniref:chemotaxis protein CheA n=1 Tax=Zymomonas mobilis TaxID=542 RepID=UPI00026D81D1|nr:chemotaxis protein CheA [Zymomonas mobilis]AFN57007.1 CheA signal transduction histidine kinase [Zymomonas mobilis subsp. mobilis ATCC 29191]TQK77554.1 two-component system chemotaxis sensor kinase CheA [Zymomonas mobilis]TQL15793.1 two-component system chemotaxis sensor kinase CheA [Zymomonas mobilis]GEB88168.1 chemotaxis protein CheA [Zymomonas mobilis subsp. mobilis]